MYRADNTTDSSFTYLENFHNSFKIFLKFLEIMSLNSKIDAIIEEGKEY